MNTQIIRVCMAALLAASGVRAADLSKVPQAHETPEQRDERMRWFSASNEQFLRDQSPSDAQKPTLRLASHHFRHSLAKQPATSALTNKSKIRS